MRYRDLSRGEDQNRIVALINRIQELENEVRELREQIAAITASRRFIPGTFAA